MAWEISIPLSLVWNYITSIPQDLVFGFLLIVIGIIFLEIGTAIRIPPYILFGFIFIIWGMWLIGNFVWMETITSLPPQWQEGIKNATFPISIKVT